MKSKEMTPEQKRVAIAKDVIAQLRAKTIKPTNSGWYANAKCDQDSYARKDLQKVLPDLGRCEVCAIGAAFLSAVRLFDGVKTENASINYLATSCIGKWFGYAQRRMIEAAYEGQREDAHGYYGGIPDSSDRLKAIMRNIIRNKGTFKPTADDFQKASGAMARA